MPRHPLYRTVYDRLLERLAAGHWAPGKALPPEPALAAEAGVSTGTVRKAVDLLCQEGALVRVQGSGTFVAEQTSERSQFRFFRLTDAVGAPVTPVLLRQICSVEAATSAQAEALGLATGDPVHVIGRVRGIAGSRALLETVVVPEALMPGLSDNAASLPNALYPHYQARYGVTVLATDERLSAVNADARQARQLATQPGAALMVVHRVARDLTDRPVEHRISYILTGAHAFTVTLR